MSSDSNELKSSTSYDGGHWLDGNYTVIPEKTGNEDTIAIFNEANPLEWVEADPDHVEDLEGMR